MAVFAAVPFFVAVFANSFYRATIQGFHAELGFLFVFGLLENVGIPAFVVTVKVIRSNLAAGITVNARIIYIEFAWCIVFVFKVLFGHLFVSLKSV